MLTGRDKGIDMAENSRNYSLVLKKGGRVLFRSRQRGLRPLVRCVARFSGRLEKAVLEDKVVGMAAARLISFSGMISRVEAGAISEEALGYLLRGGIEARGGPWTKGKSCRWERLAADCPDDRLFFSFLVEEFGLSPKRQAPDS